MDIAVMETSEALHWTRQQQQKIDMDLEQQLYTPKIEDIATAVIEMHGDIDCQYVNNIRSNVWNESRGIRPILCGDLSPWMIHGSTTTLQKQNSKLEYNGIKRGMIMIRTQRKGVETDVGRAGMEENGIKRGVIWNGRKWDKMWDDMNWKKKS
ncbi:hypothetical protein LAZ67_18000307 [Cordylochernes scorpioides]|uniref:Uncharacterized protein n=1 Tax=Cordylochernes scorpioides TaxID=51811 RepID=A0ABY6LEU2_9ARAC|nr:hypothetical protein LAZ67_18000307 [Cordylochernes scorpioides]